MKKKKDKVTLPKGEVDKAEPFQFIEPVNPNFDFLKKFPPKVSNGIMDQIRYSPKTESSYDGTDNPYYLDELGITIGIDPYHIEPIDNPQKQEIGWTDIYGNEIKEAKERRLIEDEAFALNLLKAIKKDHPEVLKKFLEDDNTK